MMTEAEWVELMHQLPARGLRKLVALMDKDKTIQVSRFKPDGHTEFRDREHLQVLHLLLSPGIDHRLRFASKEDEESVGAIVETALLDYFHKYNLL